MIAAALALVALGLVFLFVMPWVGVPVGIVGLILFVLYLAGLQEVPRELYEAAAVDGASNWEQIRYITLPLLRRTTTLVILHTGERRELTVTPSELKA